MKVAKFGGSSLASGDQIKKVFDIMKSDTDRRILVVSAPGKRNNDDEKVTDLLIELANSHIEKKDGTVILEKILERYQSIVEELKIKSPVMAQIRQHYQDLWQRDDLPAAYLLDAYKASGEDNNAKLIAAYFTEQGLESLYVSPSQAKLLVSDEPGNAQVLPQAYDELVSLLDIPQVVIFPGFFGVSEEGNIVTFSRGGSDITGAILAKALEADLYENFTDVDAIYVAHPGIVKNPLPVDVLSYREMRELSYAGFSVLHGEALYPAFSSGIPVHVRNTNNIDTNGTYILRGKGSSLYTISGIASSSGFISIYIQKFLMNHEVGFLRRVLQIFEDFGISVEHVPTGIDDITVLMRADQLEESDVDALLNKLKTDLKADQVYVNKYLCLIMLVGEGMINAVGTTARVTRALARKQINIEVFNQGASEVSMMFGIEESLEKAAVKALYEEFFEEKVDYQLMEK